MAVACCDADTTHPGANPTTRVKPTAAVMARPVDSGTRTASRSSSPGCGSADSVPNLEIDENDVACSHASAVGPLDADQVFYLESRGVPTDIATQLIVEGFFTSVVEGSAIVGLGDVLRSAVASRLANVEIEPQIVLEAN